MNSTSFGSVARFACGSVFALLAACGGGEDSAQNGARYEGDALVVDGARYARQNQPRDCGGGWVCGQAGTYAAGRVLVGPNDEAAVLELAAGYGLRVISTSAQRIILEVPILFEEQWAAALPTHSVVRYAEVDGLVCTTYMAPGIELWIYDATTGSSAACDAEVTLRDGDYAEARRSDSVACGGGMVHAAYERPGRYTVTVTKPGYRAWQQSDVMVSADLCHVGLTTVRADLVPE